MPVFLERPAPSKKEERYNAVDLIRYARRPGLIHIDENGIGVKPQVGSDFLGSVKGVAILIQQVIAGQEVGKGVALDVRFV